MAQKSEQSPRGRRHNRHRTGSAGTALIVVDMLNPYRHSEAERLSAHVSDALPGIQTLLSNLLDQMAVDRLVLCGQVTEQCIFYSALDAHVRHFKVAAPTDGVAAIYEHLAEAALEMMERNLSAELCRASECPLQESAAG